MILILLITLSLGLTQEQPQQLKLGEQKISFMRSTDWNGSVSAFYSISIDKKLDDKDLIVIVKGASPHSDPDVLISTEHQNPTTVSEANVSCFSMGADACVVNSKEIQENKNYYIGVICERMCRYSIEVYYQEEYAMGMNNYLEFKAAEVEIVKVMVDKLTEDVKYLQIRVQIENLLNLEEEFKVTLNQGNNPPSTGKYDIIAKDQWNGEKIINLEVNPMNQKDKLEVGNYTMLIESSQGSHIIIDTETFGQIREIQIYTEVDDEVEQEGVKFYRLNLDVDQEFSQNFKDDDLVFRMIPFTGNPDLFINQYKQPLVLDQYKWSSAQKSDETIVISAKERNRKEDQDEVYYIAVYGEVESTFALYIMPQSEDNNFIQLNEPLNGVLDDNEIINYKFLINSQKQEQVVVSLEAYQANVDVIVQLCKGYDCFITQKEIDDRKQLKNQQGDALFIYGTSNGNDILQFQANPDECQVSNYSQTCVYNVAIFPNEQQMQQVDELVYSYSLIVSTPQDNSIINLQANKPFKDYVEINRWRYYRFTFKSEEIRMLSFTITPIQGEQIIYVKKSTIPDEKSYDQKSDLNSIRYSKWQNNLEPGTYYIGVQGKTAGIYQIMAMMVHDRDDFRNPGSFAFQYAQLMPGIPQEAQDKGLFKIDLGFNYIKDDINIVLQVISGNFTIYANDSPVKDMQQGDSKWKGKNSLTIHQNLTAAMSYDEDTMQVIYVQVFGTGQYKITYYFGSMTQELLLDIPVKAHMYQNENQQYKYAIQKNQEIQLTLSTDQLNQTSVIAYISLDTSNQKPNKEEYSRLLKAGETCTLNYQDLASNDCFIDDQQCYVYINVEAQDDAYYTISVIQNDDNPILLYEGEAFQLPLKDTKFYMYVKENKELIVLSTSGSSKLFLYANVQRLQSSDKSKWLFPTQNKYQYTSDLNKAYKSNSITIKDFNQYDCDKDQGCIVTILVHPKKNIADGTFSITFTQSILPLMEGIQQSRYLQKDAIHYYKFNVAQNQTTIFLSLNHFDHGDPDLYVSYGEDCRPTPLEYDWKGDFLNEDAMIITPNSSNIIKDSMKGTYVVGVYGYESGIYTINYITGDIQFMQIFNGIPIHAQIRQGELVYFQHNHLESDKSFKVILTVLSGTGKVFGTSFENIDQAITQPLSSMEYSSTNQINIPSSDCNQDVCKYLFVVMGSKDAEFIITVTGQSEYTVLPENTQQLDYVQKGQQQRYHLFTEKDFDFQFILYSGEVKVYGKAEQAISNSQYFFQEIVDKDNNIVVKQLSPKQNEQEAGVYSILVEGLQNSNYTIQYMTHDSTEKIRFGYPTYITLDSQEQIELDFSIAEEGNQKIYLTIVVQGDFKDNYPDKPLISIYGQNNEREIESDFYHYLQYSYSQFDCFGGKQKLSIKNPNSQKLSYLVTLGNKEINLLIPHQIQFRSSYVGQMNNFEIPINTPSLMFYDITVCNGYLNAYTSKDYQSLQQGIYDQQYKYEWNKQMMFTSNADGKSSQFMGIKAVMGQNNQAFYGVRVLQLKPNSYVPMENFYPGNEGLTDWKIKDDNLIIQASTLKCQKCDDTRYYITKYYYLLGLFRNDGENKVDNKVTICNMDYNSSNKLKLQIDKSLQFEHKYHQNLDQIQIKIPLKDLQQGKQYFYSLETYVLVQTNNKEEISLTYFYDPQSLEIAKQTSFFTSLFFIMMLILIFAGVGVFILYKRYLSLKARLKYELSDVRTLAKSEQQQEVELKYKGLMEQ